MFLTSLMRILLTRSIKPFTFVGTHENRLDFMDLNNLGLYVHIPFCRSICAFCPYCKEIYNKQKADTYKTALLCEIDLVCRDMKEKKEVTSLYFGGGTPALMIDDLGEIIQKLKKYFTILGGVGVELHPDDINVENLSKLKLAGVSMVSLGIQSFNKDCLEKIGRENDSFVEKLETVKKAGFDVIDVDLIFAIPGQTDKILRDDIKTAFEHGATQISTYPFIDFTFANNKYKPMSEKVKKAMLKNLNEYCSEIGVERSSVWTFAKGKTEKYSSVTRDNFLGFGASATTLLKNNFKINTFSLDAYYKRVEKGELPTSLTLNFTKRQRAVYYLFWAAYSMNISSLGFEETVGITLEKMFGFELFIAQKLRFLIKQDNCYILTDKASYIYHYIEQVYTTAYIDKMWNISRLQPFPDRIVLK